MRPFRSHTSSSASRSVAGPPWTLTFLDLVLILLAFAVMDFAMRHSDTEDWVQFRDAFLGAGLSQWLEPRGAGQAGDAGQTAETREALDLPYLYALLAGQTSAPGSRIALRAGTLDLELPKSWLGPDGAVSEEGAIRFAELADILSRTANPVDIVAPLGDREWVDAFADAGAARSALADRGYLRPVGVFVERGGADRLRLLVRPNVRSEGAS